MLYRELPEEDRRLLVLACVAELSYLRFGSRHPYYLIDGQLRREVVAVIESADNFMSIRVHGREHVKNGDNGLVAGKGRPRR
jgi:hypothetical protein